ncbi:hypothetical protein CEK25_012486 [Fusarium fujikuroi]|nr:hypothetical protein CEK25_012486 [Fusarium fujikuroi]
MVVVAVAGGTGGIGGAIVDTLRPNPHHKMVILTRKKHVDSMAKIPDDTNVHTDTFVTLDYSDVDAMAKSNLVKATAKATMFTLFISSASSIQSSEERATSSKFLYSQAEIGQDNGWTSWGIQYAGTEYAFSGMDQFRQRPTFQLDKQRVAHLDGTAHDRPGIPGTRFEPTTFLITADVANLMVAAIDMRE